MYVSNNIEGAGEGVVMTSSKISKCYDRAENWCGDEFRYVDYKNARKEFAPLSNFGVFDDS